MGVGVGAWGHTLELAEPELNRLVLSYIQPQGAGVAGEDEDEDDEEEDEEDDEEVDEEEEEEVQGGPWAAWCSQAQPGTYTEL